MNNRVLVSVIMCVYNTPQEFLNEAVLSIINQTYSNFELLIVDDGSTYELFTSSIFNDRRIRILKNNKNHGPSYSRNQALSIAKGKYIAIMDSDDISLPYRLEKQLNFLEQNSDIVACGSWFQNIGEKSNVAKRNIDDNDYYRCCLIFGNIPTLLNSSAFIRRRVLIENNIIYDEELRFGEDYKMWVELSRFGKVTNFKEVLVKYRVHDKQVTYNNSVERQKLKTDSKVRLMQLNCISKSFSKDEKDLFVSYYLDKKVRGIKYYKLLNKICSENRTSLFVCQNSLEKRTKEQWKNKIASINNPFTLIFLMIRLPKESGNILKTKWEQFLSKIRNSR